MAQKAEAWREYREAAMVEMLLDTLPKVKRYESSNNAKFLTCFYIYNTFTGGR